MLPSRRQPTLSDFLSEIAEQLDVPKARHAAAERAYQSVGSWLGRENSKLKPLSPKVFVQGSFALGTAVRPIGGDDHYDLDAVCQVNWDKRRFSQQQLKEIVGSEIQGYVEYKKMEEPEPGRRCWTLNYSDEAQFHMDILPAVPDAQGQRSLMETSGYDISGIVGYLEDAISITDEKHRSYQYPTADWLGSNPLGYRKWFVDQTRALFEERRAAIAMNERVHVDKVPSYRIKTPLQLSVQLLKRHRDIMFADDETGKKPISIIITTLAGKAYGQQRDVFDALRNIIDSMERHIEIRGGAYWIPNPVDPRENFADKWAEHPERKDAFYEWTDAVKQDLATLAPMTDVSEIVEHFGGKLGHDSVEGAAKSLFPGVLRAKSLPEALKQRVFKAEHKSRPAWPVNERYNVHISNATVSRSGFRTQALRSNDFPLPKHHSLCFRATTNVPPPFDVHWQVVNTGDEAERANSLRGGFDKGVIEKGKLKKKESTLYSGTHTIECFIVKGGYCVAQSGPFVVNIQ